GWTADHFLVYATGGAAWTNNSYTVTASGLVVPPSVDFAGLGSNTSFSDNRTGWVVGGGVEWMLSRNWLLRTVYLHYQVARSSTVLPLLVDAGASSCTPGQCNWAVKAGRLDIDTVRAGVSYKFY